MIDRAVLVPGEDGRPAEMIGLLIDVTGLHDALEAQVESERRLRTTIGNIPGMVYRSQAAAPWSDELIAGGDVSVTGYSVEELTHPDFRWDRIMHPDDIPLLEEASLSAFASGRGATEYRIFARDGSERWLLDRFTLLKDEDGAPVAQEGVLLDVTDQHRVEERLRASQRELELHARIATIFLTGPADAMFTEVLSVVRESMGARWAFFGYLDSDGALVAPSLDAEIWDACRVEGKPLRFPRETWGDNTWSRALLGKRSEVLEHPGTVPEGHLPVSRAVATPIVHGDEAIGLFIVAERGTAFDDEDVRLLESIAASTAPILHEWRERRVEEAARLDAERALRESEQRYHALYDGSPVGVFALDRDLVFLDCNAAFEEMFVIPDEGFHGKPAAQFIRQDEVLQALQAALQGKESVYEGAFETLGGRSLWLTIKAAPRRGADGEVVGVTGVVVDRTRQRDSEEKIRHLLLHDPVTGLANRSLLEDRVSQALKHAQRKRLTFALAAFRVDRFDAFESSLGLQGVDPLLEKLGRRLQSVGRAEDTVAYLGGGAFAALLPGASGPAEATAAVNGLLGAVGDPLELDQRELFLSLSLGVALYPTDGAATAELLRNAEAAMRRASDGGGARWQFFHPGLNEEQADRLTLEAELHRALRGRPVLPRVPAAGRRRDGGDRRRRGAGPLAPPRARRRAAAGLHPRRGRHRDARPDRRVGPRRGLQPGALLAAARRQAAPHVGQHRRPSAPRPDARRHGPPDASRHRVRRTLARTGDHRDGGHARRSPHGADPRSPAGHGRARRARRLRYGLLLAQPPRAPAHLHGQDRPLLRPRPAHGARTRGGGGLRDRPRPPPGPHGGRGGRRDHR